MFWCRITAIFHGFHIIANRLERRATAFHEIPDESRLASRRNIQDIVEHEDLPVDMRSGADADHREIDAFLDRFSHFVRYAFE